MFRCIQCGECCNPAKSKWGIPKDGVLAKAGILFRTEDIVRVASFFKLDANEFRKKFNISQSGMVDVTHSPCPFLSEEKTCSIHDVKPSYCRDWPKGATQQQLKDCRGYHGDD